MFRFGVDYHPEHWSEDTRLISEAGINIDDWKDKEEDGILYVPKAGETLYRLK
jgi:hypothetical protein